MPNTYHGVYSRIKKLPVIYKDSKTVLPGSKTTYFANETKEYNVCGTYLTPPYNEKPQLKLIEQCYEKLKGFTWFNEIPYFKKISVTKSNLENNLVEVTRATGKGFSTLTNYDAKGIRTTKVVQRINPETKLYDYSRLLFNKRGTQPKIIKTWSDDYKPLDELTI